MIQTVSTTPSQDALSPAAVEFINSLPITSDTIRWGLTLRESLRQFLGDVDYIIVNVCAGFNLLNPRNERERRSRVVRRSLNPSTREAGVSLSGVVKGSEDLEHWEQLLQEAPSKGLDLGRYSDPAGFDFIHDGQVCGTVILLRYTERGPVSLQTLKLMESIRPYLTHMFVAHIARKQLENPTLGFFRHMIRAIEQKEELTDREEEVLIYQLLGQSYEETANRMFVSVNTVKFHLKSIYRKTECSTLKEVLARYMTPLIEGLDYPNG